MLCVTDGHDNELLPPSMTGLVAHCVWPSGVAVHFCFVQGACLECMGLLVHNDHAATNLTGAPHLAAVTVTKTLQY